MRRVPLRENEVLERHLRSGRRIQIQIQIQIQNADVTDRHFPTQNTMAHYTTEHTLRTHAQSNLTPARTHRHDDAGTEPPVGRCAHPIPACRTRRNNLGTHAPRMQAMLAYCGGSGSKIGIVSTSSCGSYDSAACFCAGVCM